MGSPKKYSGYKSFSYLKENDFKKYEIDDDLKSRGSEVEILVKPDEKKRLNMIIQENIVISLHDHLVSLAKQKGNMVQEIKGCHPFTPYEAISQSYLDAVFDNQSMYVFFGAYNKGWKWIDAVHDLGMRFCDIEHQDLLMQGKNISDIERAHNEGKVAFIPSFESCTMIENELDRLDVLYGLGVRMLGITYSDANLLGSGLNEAEDRGLTIFGRKAVERLNRLGIAIDVAHCGDQTSLDVIELSEKPIFISHAGARKVWNTRRMVPDDVIIACAKKGGVIGIEAAPHTTCSDKNPEQNIDAFFDHLLYCIDLVGVDHVAFGPDTIYGDHCGLHEALSEGLSLSAFKKKDATNIPEVAFVKGLENPTECSINIPKYLVKLGFSDEDIAKVIGGNVLRVLKEAWIK